MGCSCNINPPCSYCTELYECKGCGKLRHPDLDGVTKSSDEEGDGFMCDDCYYALKDFLEKE